MCYPLPGTEGPPAYLTFQQPGTLHLTGLPFSVGSNSVVRHSHTIEISLLVMSALPSWSFPWSHSIIIAIIHWELPSCISLKIFTCVNSFNSEAKNQHTCFIHEEIGVQRSQKCALGYPLANGRAGLWTQVALAIVPAFLTPLPGKSWLVSPPRSRVPHVVI